MEIGKGATKTINPEFFTLATVIGEVKVDNNGGPKKRASESPLKYCSLR